MAQLPSTNAIPFSHMFSPVRVDFAWHLARLPFKVHLLWVIVSLSCNLKERTRKKTKRLDGSTTLHQCYPFFPYVCSRRFCVTSGTFTIQSASIVGNCLAIMQFKRKSKKKNKNSRWLNYPPPMLSPFPLFFPRSHRFRVTSDTFTIKNASIVGNCLAIMQKQEKKDQTEYIDGSTTLHQCYPFFPYFFPCSRRFRVTSGTFTIQSASIVGNCLAIM